MANFDEIDLKFRSTSKNRHFLLSFKFESSQDLTEVFQSYINHEMCGSYINLPEALILYNSHEEQAATAQSRECLMYIE